MQKTLACVALLLAGSLAGCSKDQQREPETAGYDTQPRGHSVPTRTARAEPTKPEGQPGLETEWPKEPGMTPASGSTEGMTPASGTAPGAAAEGSEPVALGPGGPVLLQYESANYLSQALCKHEAECGRAASPSCEETSREKVSEQLESCDQGIGRVALSECLSAIEQYSCGDSSAPQALILPCETADLCAR